jgi:hypothetical protein
MNTLRLYLVAFLLLLMSAQFLYKTGFIVYFVTQKAQIIKEFCENKDKPKMKCDGKCHLKKYVKSEIKQEQQSSDTQESPSIPDLKHLKNFNFYYIADQLYSWDGLIVFINRAFIDQQSITAFFYKEHIGRIHSGSLFHPPLV